jgi:hypothetical protein
VDRSPVARISLGGDVMAAGSTVMIDGPVHGSIRAAGQSVQLRNQVDGDLLATGNSIGVVGDGAVGRDCSALRSPSRAGLGAM